jgi:hypothetical protein
MRGIGDNRTKTTASAADGSFFYYYYIICCVLVPHHGVARHRTLTIYILLSSFLKI